MVSTNTTVLRYQDIAQTTGSNMLFQHTRHRSGYCVSIYMASTVWKIMEKSKRGFMSNLIYGRLHCLPCLRSASRFRPKTPGHHHKSMSRNKLADPRQQLSYRERFHEHTVHARVEGLFFLLLTAICGSRDDGQITYNDALFLQLSDS
jgi:hypothetical protein